MVLTAIECNAMKQVAQISTHDLAPNDTFCNIAACLYGIHATMTCTKYVYV